MSDEEQQTEDHHYVKSGQAFVRVSNATGRRVALDGVRGVAVAVSDKGDTVLAFDGPTGKRLMFSISPDARAALLALLGGADVGEPFTWENPTERTWVWKMIVDEIKASL